MSRRDQWLGVAKKFLKVYRSYPKSHSAYKAIFTVGKLYEDLYEISRSSKDLNQALGYYGKLVQEFDWAQLKDDALYRRGEIYFKKNHYALAKREFEKIVRHFPKGDQIALAQKRLTQTASLLSRAKSPGSAQAKHRKKIVKAPQKTVSKAKHTQKKLSLPPAKKPANALALLEQLSPASPKYKETKKPSPSQDKVKAPPAKKNPVKTQTAEKKIPLVILDPGHGGKDFGAKGLHGTLEKTLNLKISKKVKRILEDKYKLRVNLTRSDDTFIPLKERGPIANRMKADLFVSIHANAAKRKAAHGIETYYLGRGLSKQAKETAARENGDLVYSIPDDQTQQILADLISNNKMNDSSRLAGRVQRYLYQKAKKRYRKVKNLGVKEGPFWVLHDTNMPSILIEVGFVTNAKEEARLKDEIYLNLLAEAVASGISDFLRENGPTI